MIVSFRQPLEGASPTVQAMLNRGIDPKNIQSYIHSTDECISPPEAFGIEVLEEGYKIINETIEEDKTMCVVVDADCDGFTSAAIFINYLFDIFPTYVRSNLQWYLHSSKQHGLNDCMEFVSEYDTIILPDSSSNDYDYHKELAATGKRILVLDHHEAPSISEYACVINNQLSDYPNKDLSGAGVVWQFCRYLDKKYGTAFAADYIDLCSLGNMADMMDIRTTETKHLIHKGCEEDNVKNPFIYYLSEKNAFSLGKPDYKSALGLRFTPMGAAFFIAPFVNAIVRSGTLDEKELVFESMLKFKAYEEILSNKRGHKLGEMEKRVEQAMRCVTNVKKRQTTAQDKGMTLLETMIKEQGILNHKVMLFLLKPGQIDRNIAGLVANKLVSKYQRPCCVLTRVTEEQGGNEVVTYQGSARGYEGSGFKTFKDLCEASDGCIFAAGHQGAFGLGLDSQKIEDYLNYTDTALSDLLDDPTYFVDFVWESDEVDDQAVLDLAGLNDYLGKGFERPYVSVKNIQINENNFKVMKSNTLKITLPNGIDIIKFNGTEDEIEKFTKGCKINGVFKCAENEWLGNIKPQLILEDYIEVTELPDWGF